MSSGVQAAVRVLVVSVVVTLGLAAPPASPVAQPLSSQAVSGEPWYWTGVSTMGASPSSPVASRVQGEALATMSDDSVLVAGYFSHQAVVPTGPGVDDSIVLTASGEFDILLAHLDTRTGYFTWAQRAGGTLSDQAYAVAVTRDDTAIVTGFIRGTSRFPTGPNTDDSIVLVSSGDQDIFVAAINTDTGYFTWAQRAGGAETLPPVYSQDAGYGLATGRDDTIVVTGEFEGTATFPSGPVTSLSLTSSGGTDVFIAAVDPATGYFAWAQRAGGTRVDEGLAVALTSTGRPMVTGRVTGAASFPTAADDSITVTVADFDSDIFIATLNADDSYFSWVQTAGGIGLDTGLDLALTADDTPMVTGRFVDSASFPTGPAADDSIQLSGSGIDVFVASMNADDSYFVWAQRATGPETSEGLSISLTTSGAPVVSGIFKDALSFPTGPGADDSITMDSPGNSDAFVAGLDPASGYFTWSQQAGSTSSSGRDASGKSVAMLGDDTAIVSGYFASTASFPSGPSTTITRTTQPAGAAANLFLGVIGPYVSPSPPPPPPPAPAFPPSAPSHVVAQPGDASASIAWTAPSSAGSFPITTYQVQALPGGSSCMVAAPTLVCEVTGLANGETYTASVRALNGAGWGPFSTSSEPFTPSAPELPSILINGTRGEVRGRPGVIINGKTTGMIGQELTPRVRVAGQLLYASGVPLTVSDTESFTWQRRAGKRVFVYFQGESVRSNRLVIPAR